MFDHSFSSVVPFDKKTDKLLLLDLTTGNANLSPEVYTDTERFATWINKRMRQADARYGVGGYKEHRVIYNRSGLFNTDAEPRRLHLGEDIWGPAGTTVFAPLAGIVHSAAYNGAFGDYGGTIILEHHLHDQTFFTLFGHLTASARGLQHGQPISQGEAFAAFGDTHENGGWPPHLHFQIILNMSGFSGDYPGVCRFSEQATWLANSPDPQLILKMH